MDEWASLALEDADGELHLDVAMTDLESKIKELEALSPFSGPDDQCDCMVEIECSEAEWRYAKACPMIELATKYGYQVTELFEDQRRTALEITGHLAYGRVKQFAGTFAVPKSELSCSEEKGFVKFHIDVYPVPKVQIGNDLPAEDLNISYLQDRKSCGGSWLPHGIRITDKPKKLTVIVESWNNKAWCQAKAMQLLRCKLEAGI